MFRALMLAVVCIAFAVIPAQAKRVEPEQAEKLARSYVQSRHKQRGHGQAEVRLRRADTGRHGQRQQRPDGTRRTHEQAQAQDEALFYVFNVNEDKDGGFVIVAGDDVARPVLGYSENGNFDEDNIPPNFAYWLEYLGGQIAYALENNLEQSEEARREWEGYINGVVFAPASAVFPLIDTKWHQRAPYNNMTPMVGSNRSVTGCVATAMAQIMKYHNHPARGSGRSDAYVTRTLEISVPSVNFEIDYDWDNMQNTYTSSTADTPQNNAVATLMYHAGVSVQMDYSPTGSGAYSRDVPMALTAYFGYDRSIQRRLREDYDDAAWEAMLVEQVDAGMPVYYDGRNDESGHAFILDGYDGAGKFHFNWGWGGLHDGYFVTTALNPGVGGDGAGTGTYNDGQNVIINIKPEDGSIVNDFYRQIAVYRWSTVDVVVEVDQDLILDRLVSIPANANGAELTIRSVNPNVPVILTRGINGNLFTVLADAHLILENIIIDGDRDGNFANGGGSLIRVNNGGTVIINGGSVVRNNANNDDGGGVNVANGGTLFIDGGEISGNTANDAGGVSVVGTNIMFAMFSGKISGNIARNDGGGVSVAGANTIFTMSGGKISGNTASNAGGGVENYSGSTFTMSGGEISGNTAVGNGGAIINWSGGGEVSLTGGVVAGTGTRPIDVISGTHTLAGNCVVIRWNKPAGDGPFVYTAGTSTDLTVLPADVATAVWAVEGDILGISYANGDNTGFIDTDARTPTVSVLSTDRVIPINPDKDAAAVVPVNRMTAQFTAGPNPVSRSSGVINFFWQGRQIDNASLTIFDASGNVVNRITCRGDRPRSLATSESTTITNTQNRRLIGAWNLTDTKGRPVSEGTYLARGIVTMLDGKRERVSVIIGVR